MPDTSIPVNFTLSQLEYFIASVESGSFTAAAEALGVSQPAVADQIARLERVAGRSLFARRARGVTPTPAGRELEPYARRVLESSRDAMATMTAGNTVGAGSVAFGTFGSPHHYGIAGLIRHFLDDHPGSRVRVEARNSSSTADAVQAGTLDAAVVVLPVDPSGLDIRPVFEGEVLYVSAMAERASRPVTIEDVASRPFILYESSAGVADPTRLQLEARAQAAGVDLRPRVEVEDADIALELAAEGVADTYAPLILTRSLDDRLHAVSFAPRLADSFALITRTGSRLGRPAREFVDRLVAHLLDQIGEVAEPNVETFG